jgi:hypothetical protein
MRPLIFYIVPYFSLFSDYIGNVYENAVSRMSSKVEEFTVEDTPAKVFLCSAEGDIMKVDSVSLVPDPPAKGSNLSVIITGDLQKDLLQDAFLMVRMQKGPFKFPQIKMGVCDYVSSGCPIEKGERSIEMKFEIPRVIPGGTYEIETELFNPDSPIPNKNIGRVGQMPVTWFLTGDRVACLKGEVQL